MTLTITEASTYRRRIRAASARSEGLETTKTNTTIKTESKKKMRPARRTLKHKCFISSLKIIHYGSRWK